MIDNIDLLQDYMDGCRVVILINRGVNNSKKGSRRWVSKKLISLNKAELLENIQQLKEYQKYLNEPENRIYMSLNSRNLDKSISLFQHKQIDAHYFNNSPSFYKNLNNEFVRCLMKPENRVKKYYLIDLDTKENEELESKLFDYKLIPEKKYYTPNGYHYVMSKFNIKILEGIKNCEVKKDGLLLVHTI